MNRGNEVACVTLVLGWRERIAFPFYGTSVLRQFEMMEVNSSPRLEGIETATGKNLAGKIIAFIEASLKIGKTATKGKG